MGCSNCFNGCGDNIISDKCVKYTGNDFTLLSTVINTGDSLFMVEQDIFALLLQMNDGTGIQPTLNYVGFCTAINDLLPGGNNSTINEVLEAFGELICNHQGQIETMLGVLTTLEANYTVGCLAPVLPSAGTHAILQAVIDKLCIIEADLVALTLELHTNYVLISDIDTYIQDFIDNSPTTSLVNNKMVPYIAYPYFGPTLGNFDITGAGIGDWVKIYLCNGVNNTPDLRGRVVVGCTTMGSNPFSPAVDPGIPGNPTYTLNTFNGANNVILSVNQLASHSHSITVAATTSLTGEIRHISQSFLDWGSTTGIFTKLTGYSDDETPEIADYADTGGVSINANHTHTASAGNAGSNEAHPNIQPVIAGNYIMYIP